MSDTITPNPPEAPPPRTEARLCKADSIHEPFFLAGMAVVLTAGAAWGVALLAKIGAAGSFTEISVHEVNAHGHAQITGWVGLFVMGFAYRTFPRMWEAALPAPRLAVGVWLAALLSIALRSTAMALHTAPWSLATHRAGTFLEWSAVIGFVGQLLLTWRRGGAIVRPSTGFILAALAAFALQSALSGWHTDRLLRAASRDELLHQIATFQAPLRDLQIHGRAMLMIFGVGLHRFPYLLGVTEVKPARAWSALALMLAALAFETSLFTGYRLAGNRALASALILPWTLWPVAAWLIAGSWRLWRPLQERGGGTRLAKFVRAAFLWLFVSLAMLLLSPLYRVWSGIPFSHAYYGAVRHAITVGFISMMIVGMAARTVPRLRGLDPRPLPALWSVFLLLNIGCLLRVAFQVSTDWHSGFFPLLALSGALEWTALALWSAHLLAVMLGLGRYRDGARVGGRQGHLHLRNCFSFSADTQD